MFQTAPTDQSVQAIKNWAYDPSFYTIGPTDSYFGTLSTVASYTYELSSVGAPVGCYRMRTDTLTADGAYGRRWGFTRSIPVKLGDVVRVSYWMKASFAAIGNPYLEFSTASLGYSNASSSLQLAAVTPNVWTRFSYTHTVSNANAAFLRSVGNYSSGAGTTTSGNTLSFAGLVITINQPLPEVYCDGATPGWKWTGAVGASASVGWPYKLESIAGPPLLSLASTGEVITSGVPALQGRTLYSVYDIFDQTASYGSMSALGSSVSSEGRMAMQTGSANTSGMSPRWDTLAGTTNKTRTHANARTTGRHVGMLTTNDGMTEGYSKFDTGEYLAVNGGLTPGSGMATFRIGAAAPTTDRAHVYSIAYATSHDAVTADRIIRWLATKYGISF